MFVFTGNCIRRSNITKLIDNLPYSTNDTLSMQNAYSNTSLDFIGDETKANKETGELYYIHKRKYLNLTLIFKLNNAQKLDKLTIRGSVHKLFNNGLHNANIFTFKDFKTTLNRFSNKLGINLSECYLLPFEYGNNLYLNEFSTLDAREIILNTFCENRKMFQPNALGIETSKISGSYNSEMRFKAYTKSDEYPNYCTNTLRLETQQKKSRDLQKNGIIKVTDLFKLKNQIYLFEKHINYIKKIVLFDYTIVLPKNSKYKKLINDFKNPNHWIKLIKKCKNREVYNTKYNEEIDLLNYLSKKYGSNILEILIQQTKIQWIKSLGVCQFTTLKLIKKPKYARLIKPKYALLYNTCIDTELKNGFILYHTKKKVTNCLITGYDISMQKDDSKLLSHTGIKYYKKNNYKLYEQLENRFLTNNWINSKDEVKIKEIAHNIRNKLYNNPTIPNQLILELTG